jgi:endonuclease III
MPATSDPVVEVLLARHGRTFANEAGIRINRNTPSPLFRLLCMSLLISARISAHVAISATRALAEAGWTTPSQMADTTWEERTAVLNQSGYARYDESTARYLERATGLLIDRYDGDLRHLRAAAARQPHVEHRLLTEFTGIGDVGADVFLREAQVVWDELDPYVDRRVLDAADALELPTTPAALRALVDDRVSFARLVAALVRSGLAGDHDEIREQASRSA